MNVLQSVAVIIAFFIIVFLLLFIPSQVQADDPHHSREVNNYSIKTIETNGLAALHAASQIHPSKNISGLQLGFGAAQYKSDYGLAAGAALNVQGWGMLNGSIAKESGTDPIIGIGINLSLKP